MQSRFDPDQPDTTDDIVNMPIGPRSEPRGAGLCTMADLDVLARELDEIDAALARMDAGRAGAVSRGPSPSP